MDVMKNILLFLTISWALPRVLSKLTVDLDQFDVMMEELGAALSNCESPKTNSIGVLSGCTSSMKWTRKSLKGVSLINLQTDLEKQFSKNIYKSQKLHTFIIIAPSSENLGYLIEKLRILWNPTALYILLDNRTMEIGCKNAEDFLDIAWEKNLLSSTFLCIESKQFFKMYTYNPFAKRAPKPWLEVKGDKVNQKNSGWTLFERNFIPGTSTCKTFNFDKTTTLDQYPIKVISTQEEATLTTNVEEHISKRPRRVDRVITGLLWKKLNVSLNVTRVENVNQDYDLIPNVASGDYDFLMDSHYIFNKPNASITYPHLSSGISILTRYPPYETGLTKILKYMNPIFLILILLVSISTVITLRIFTNQESIQAALEVLRMMLGTSMLHFPSRNPFRIYLITVFFLFVLTTSIFQSKLSSLLTSPISKPPIDEVDTLKESGYPIYMLHHYKNAIFDDVLYSRVRTTDNWDCSEYVVKYDNVACAADRSNLMKIAFEKKLHLSKHRIITLYSGHVVRPDWPLKDRASRIFLRICECGLTGYWWGKTMAQYKGKWLVMKKGKRDFHIMRLRDLKFVFSMLLYGMMASILALLIEIVIYRWKKPDVKKIERAVVLPFVP